MKMWATIAALALGASPDDGWVTIIDGPPFVVKNRVRPGADVKEVWKGPKMGTIEHLASPTYPCDIANAKKGEGGGFGNCRNARP